ncbi:hypothetical protein [Engelhardtia mirabilis]|uniref:CARDB domain-containing protein n=1 Tax=Engelhardtia mirabilis TaxID=2528011 RepID=A0A518BLC5_9BACT|nr:hypothetical protein Pla133_28630 [Planctomycetes bacterium Pla133]QDV02100.1 hypothetical protein Pla86_28620 [Planctomycetes bacterium Pla86]
MKLARPFACIPVVLACCLLLSGSRQADAGGTLGFVYKPDLRVLKLGPSIVSSNHARLLVTNQGKWGSPACWAKITCYGPSKTHGYAWIPPMNPGDIYGVDGWVGQLMSANAGQMSVAWIDCYQSVAESNEGNNLTYYIAPPH